MEIKRIPEDFVVQELIDLQLSKKGDYVYFWLIKKEWATIRALQKIASACGVSIKRFKFAGTKDKHALTKQVISAYKVPESKLRSIRLKDIKIEIIGRGRHPIALGQLRGNAFKIVIRKVRARPSKKKIERLIKFGFPNYFGQQRFGRGHTHLIGRELLRGDLKRAVWYLLCYIGDKETPQSAAFRKYAQAHFGDWKAIIKQTPKYLSLERAILNWLIKRPADFAGALRVLPKPARKLYVHAYQSYLFNRGLAKWLELKYKGKWVKLVGDLKIFIPILDRAIKKDLVLPGWNVKPGRSIYWAEIVRALKEDGLTLNNFKCARMPELELAGERRAAFVKPAALTIGELEDDELNPGYKKFTISFELPKGAYATVLLAQLF